MRSKLDQQVRTNDCGNSAIITVYNLLHVRPSRNTIEENNFLYQSAASFTSLKRFLESIA